MPSTLMPFVTIPWNVCFGLPRGPYTIEGDGNDSIYGRTKGAGRID